MNQNSSSESDHDDQPPRGGEAIKNIVVVPEIDDAEILMTNTEGDDVIYKNSVDKQKNSIDDLNLSLADEKIEPLQAKKVN